MVLLSEEEFKKWQKRERKKDQKNQQIYQNWLKKVTSQWKTREWESFKKKLNKLSLKEVRYLANKTGMRFAIGNSKITDKEEFILILDEADRDKLIFEYNKLIKTH